MPPTNGRLPYAGPVWKAMRILGAVILAAAIGASTAGRRGPVIGILAFLVYGSLLGVPYSRLRRWSADHVFLDALAFVPLAFLALLLIPVLAWWEAALIALVAGMIFVPLALRRRATQREHTRAASQQ